MERDSLIYRDEDFPHGLRCPRCSHVFAEPEVIGEELTGFQDDVPVVVLVCVPCSIGGGA